MDQYVSNAWRIYENDGLLEVSDLSRYGFTTTFNNYNNSEVQNAVIDPNYCVREFTIVDAPSSTPPFNPNAFVSVSEKGILVCKEGLVINNQSNGIHRIVFHTISEDFITLLGPVKVTGKYLELYYISHNKIFCNGCSFTGNIPKVHFYTLGTDRDAGIFLQNHKIPVLLPDIPALKGLTDYKFSVGKVGMLSNGVIDIDIHSANFESKGFIKSVNSNNNLNLYAYQLNGLIPSINLDGQLDFKTNIDVQYYINDWLYPKLLINKIVTNQLLTIYYSFEEIIINSIESSNTISLTSQKDILIKGALKSNKEIFLKGKDLHVQAGSILSSYDNIRGVDLDFKNILVSGQIISNKIKAETQGDFTIFPGGLVKSYREIGVSGQKLAIKAGSRLESGGGRSSFGGDRLENEGIINLGGDLYTSLNVIDNSNYFGVDGYLKVNGAMSLDNKGTFFVRGKTEGIFTGINNIQKAPATLIGSSGVVVPYNSIGEVSVNIAEYTKIIKLTNEETFNDAASNSNSPNIKVTEGNNASDEPYISPKHQPLYSCNFGTKELLTKLGVNKAQYPQIFASNDIESALIQHSMLKLTGIPILFDQLADALKLLPNGGVPLGVTTPQDKGCIQLKCLLNKGYDLIGKYNLEVGKPLPYKNLEKCEEPFAWPVTRKIDNKEVLALDLFLPFSIYENAPANFGASIILGSLDAQIEGPIQNNGVIFVNNDATIKGENLALTGTFIVQDGDMYVSAKKDLITVGTTIEVNGGLFIEARNIYELLVSDGVNPPERSTYKVGGDMYYFANENIVQQATILYVAGNLAMKAEGDITLEAIHKVRTVKEIYTKKSAENIREIDQHDMVIMVGGNIDIDAEGNFVGSGIKIASGGNININADKIKLETKTEYAVNHQAHKKKKLFSTSKTSVTWTTSSTATLEISAPNGKIYISSNECKLEGVTLITGQLALKCPSLIEKDHIVKNFINIEKSKRGFLAPNIPLSNFMKSDNKLDYVKDNSILGSLEKLIDMKGPLDLLPAISLISELPSAKRTFEELNKAGSNIGPALMGALLDKYLSITLRIGVEKSERDIKNEKSLQSRIEAKFCDIRGSEGSMSGNYECSESLYIEFDNLSIRGVRDSFFDVYESTSQSVDIGIGLENGNPSVSAGISVGEGSSRQEEIRHRPSKFSSKNIIFNINEKLEIVGGQIDGKNIKIKAGEIEFEDLIDTSSFESSSSSIGVGVTFTAAGATPYGSFSSSEAVRRSEFAQVLSKISGQDVEIITKHLIYNIASITGDNSLKIEADKISYKQAHKPVEIDREVSIMLTFKQGSDNKISGSVAGRYRDEDFVISGGYFSTFVEGLKIIKDAISADQCKEAQKQLKEEIEDLTKMVEHTKRLLEEAKKNREEQSVIEMYEKLINLDEEDIKYKEAEYKSIYKEMIRIEKKYQALVEEVNSGREGNFISNIFNYVTDTIGNIILGYKEVIVNNFGEFSWSWSWNWNRNEREYANDNIDKEQETAEKQEQDEWDEWDGEPYYVYHEGKDTYLEEEPYYTYHVEDDTNLEDEPDYTYSVDDERDENFVVYEKVKSYHVYYVDEKELEEYIAHNENREQQDQHIREDVTRKFEIEKEELTQKRDKKLEDIERRGDYALKFIDQMWVATKYKGEGLYILSREQAENYFPEEYDKIARGMEKVGEGVSYIVGEVDGILEKVGGEKYKFFKEGVRVFRASVRKNAPEIVSDGIEFITLGGIGEAAFKAAGGAASKFAKLKDKSPDIHTRSKVKDKAGENVKNPDYNFEQNDPFSGKYRIGSANKLDPYHNFNDLVDNYGIYASKFDIPTKGPNGKIIRLSELRQIEGSLNGVDGVFEWIIDGNQITHRRFIDGGKVTGIPNQKVQK